MAASITNQVIESFLKCRYKASLKLGGEAGQQSAFELFEGECKASALGRARQSLAVAPVENVALSGPVLAEGAEVIFSPHFDNSAVSIHFDALQRVDGRSDLGAFHYQPVLIVAREKIKAEHKLLLGVQAVVLGALQGRRPVSGLIIHGGDGKQSRVTLPLVRAEAVFEEVRHLESAPPKLILNEHCQVCEFQARCHTQARKNDDLSLLRGLGEKEIKNYHRRGIFTVTQLSCDFRARRGKNRPAKPRRYPALQAMAIRDNKALVVGSPKMPDSAVRIYLDLEGDPDRDFVYLLGMIVEENSTERHYSFWIDRKEDERRLMTQFAEVVDGHQDYCIFHYGSYETSFFRRMAKEACDLSQRILPRCFNVLSVLYHNVYFPTLSNSLKDIGRCVGFSWTSPEASGTQSLIWRRAWEVSGDPAAKDSLVAYNQDDCAALKRVTGFLRAVVADGQASGSSPAGPEVANVQDLSVQARKTEWNKRSPFIPEFDFINKCSYFDYQRERVFVRTNKTLLRLCKRAKKGKRRTYRINRRVELRLKRCPTCNRMLQKLRDQMRHKMILDLRITSGGITRRVTKCSAAFFRCNKCKMRMRPETFQRLAKHGHSLVSWAIYQHVVYRTSIDRLTEMFAELFGLRVHASEVMGFKELAAGYYEPTYKAILARLVSGSLLHADETQVKLNNGVKGYVWVLASMEDVIYFFRPNREGKFLKDMLKGFKGVLVTDFYGAYESLDCPKQKCLIHLMRDLNNDLLKSPFDEEFKTLVSTFAGLLKAFVATIDQRGLKGRWLAKHRKDVTAFFKRLESAPCTSEVAEGYRNRFLRHRDTLFTFLEHDGVPWNNSNAEHAIRRFAYYREVTVALLNEAGLTHYLVLLSILQTCKCKGVSFFSFLLSGATDINAYASGPRRRNPADTLVTYPDWFLQARRKRRATAEEAVADSIPGTGGNSQKENDGRDVQA
jgi:predicted RecB family nuclease